MAMATSTAPTIKGAFETFFRSLTWKGLDLTSAKESIRITSPATTTMVGSGVSLMTVRISFRSSIVSHSGTTCLGQMAPIKILVF